MLALPLWFFVAPAPPLFFFYCRLLWVSEVVITIIYFVGVYGKGFPVDSFLCFYLILLSCSLSQSRLNFLFGVAGMQLVPDQRNVD